MTPACFPSTSSSPSTCLLPAAETLQQSWPRITRFSVAALVPSAGLFLAHYAGQDAAFVHTQTYVSFMQWLLITTLVVSLPTVGKTAQKAIERALGSFLGGVLGLLFVVAPSWCQMLGMVFAAALGDFVSVHFKKDYTGRLIPMTFAIVVGGAADALHPWLAGVMRMAAVLTGILWTCTVSLIWFPDTSSRVAFKQLVKMQQHLKSLGSNTWALMEQQQLQLLQQQSSGKQHPQAQDGSSRSGSTGSAAGRLGRPTAVAAAAAAAGSDTQLKGACSSTGDKRQNAAVDDRKSNNNDASILVHSNNNTAAQHHGESTQLPNTATHRECLRVERQLQQGVNSLDQTAVVVTDRPSALQDDPCDDDVRDFFAARAVLQDALSTAGAENPVLGWLCGLAPVIVTSSSSNCTPRNPGLYTCHCLTHRAVGTFGSSAGPQARPQPPSWPQGTTAGSMAHNSTSAAMPSDIAEHVRMPRQQDMPLPHFLPRVSVTNVAVAQRHCSHVLWTLHKLMQNKFDPDSLLAINQRYPADMLQNIAQDCQAALQAAMDCLQTAIQPSRPCRGRRSSSCQVPAILQGQLQELHACSNRLHRHLKLWQETFVKAQQLRKEAMAHAKSSKALDKVAAAATQAGAVATEQHPGEVPASSSACVAAAAASAAAAAGVVPALAMPPLTPEQQAIDWCNAPVCVQLAHLQDVLDALFIVPATRDAYMFVLQWHALHYILVQLDSALAELTASLDELMRVMHGVQVVALPLTLEG